MTCAILGDSIAVGLAQAMPHCELHVRGGITSAGYAARGLAIGGTTAIISLGANDRTGDAASLRLVRDHVVARRVIWLLPNGRPARDAIARVAAEYGDEVLDTKPYCVGWRIHPDPAANLAIADKIAAGTERDALRRRSAPTASTGSR